MLLSASTGTFYSLPFGKALELIRKAGFEYIELLQYWRGGKWSLGQHLKGVVPREALRMVEASGLKIAVLHDCGGLIRPGAPSLVSKATYEYLEHADIPCIVFHPPWKKTRDKAWWDNYRTVAARDLRQFRERTLVCVENMFPVGGLAIPLVGPAEMLAFVTENDIYATIDTTHCGQAGIDLVQAAETLRSRVRTVHLSDYAHPRSHVFPGEGTLDLRGLMRALDRERLHCVTLECNADHYRDDEAGTIERLQQAHAFMKEITA